MNLIIKLYNRAQELLDASQENLDTLKTIECQTSMLNFMYDSINKIERMPSGDKKSLLYLTWLNKYESIIYYK